MSLREYNALKKKYRQKHGTNPPKGTKLPELRELLGNSSKRVTSKTTITTETSGDTSRGRSLWQSHYGRGGIR